jgi:uncharacterized protein with ParB-like and HNH nuclease domain/predicted transport protein
MVQEWIYKSKAIYYKNYKTGNTMKAKEASLLRFLHGAKQFIIPIYQRTYSWQLKQCKQLLKDILSINEDDHRPGHFIGSVVYLEQDIHTVSEVPQLLVIDGQQRLTTINLIIAAMVEFLKANLEVQIDTNHKKLRNYYLVNSEEDGELYYKLILTKKDKETLQAIIQAKPLPKEISPRVRDNYEFFKSQITSDNIEAIYNGIQKLFIVDVALERGKDNPQLIFESLNSTGLELSQADLIRNYVLMGQEPAIQKHLYENYWLPMEQSFGNKYAAVFDGFMRHYLTVKTGKISRINEVYEEYKEYTQGKIVPDKIEALIKDIFDYSTYYTRMALFQEPDKALREAFKDLNVLKVDVAFPMLLELYKDFYNDLISSEKLLKIVRYIESYVFRRVICGIPTNSLNKTFAGFMKSVDKENYVESLKAHFLLISSYRRFPSDTEMRRELLIKDVYNYRSRNYLLRKLENRDRKERVNVEEYTIEHIMPQNPNLSAQWKTDLGKKWESVQEKYLHTIGNLTLTGYNSELSDLPFFTKKTMKGGFRDSPLRLNRNVANKESWNEKSIISRANELIEKTIEIWSCPSLDESVLEKYRESLTKKSKAKYTLEHYHMDKDILELHEHLKKRILNLDSSVSEEYKKLYIAYKTSTNFVDIVPQKKKLRLSLNLRMDEIHDPKKLCKDVTNLGRWGNGDVEVGLSSLEEIDDIMDLIHQSYERRSDYTING